MLPRALWSLVTVTALAAAGCGASPAEGGAEAGGGDAPSAACTGLVPTFGTPVDLRLDTGTMAACAIATSSPTGQVAVGIARSLHVEVELFSSGGVQQGRLEPLYWISRDVDPWLHWTTAGWRGITDSPDLHLGTWDAAANLVSSITTFRINASAPDSTGGSVAVGKRVASDGSTLDEPHLLWVDAAGTITRDVRLDRAPLMVLVQWGTRHVLLVAAGGTYNAPANAGARWFDAAGRPLTAWFNARTVLSGEPMLHLLRDGRIALSSNGVWTVAFRDGSTVVDPAPPWLAARPSTRLATIPGGYAVLTDGPGPSSPATAPRLEVLDANGSSCGVVQPPPGPAPAGATRGTFAYWVGQDGTLIEGSGLTANDDSLGMGNHCAIRWWPRLWVSR